jgi:hypothetical protein
LYLNLSQIPIRENETKEMDRRMLYESCIILGEFASILRFRKVDAKRIDEIHVTLTRDGNLRHVVKGEKPRKIDKRLKY